MDEKCNFYKNFLFYHLSILLEIANFPDAADGLAVNDFAKSFFWPVCAPGVGNQPEGDSVLHSKSHNVDRMLFKLATFNAKFQEKNENFKR